MANAVIAAKLVSADALDDDFELDDGLIVSGNEAFEDEGREPPKKNGSRKPQTSRPGRLEYEDDFMASEDEDDQVHAPFEEGSAGKTLTNQQEEDEYGLPINKKRKLSSGAKEQSNGEQKENMPEDKKKKRRAKLKMAKSRKLSAIDQAESEFETSLISVQPPALQADYIAEMQLQAMPKMSSIEAEDFRIAEKYIVDTSNLMERSTMKDFIKKATSFNEADLKPDAVIKSGSPKLLVVSGAALRTADVVRELRNIAGDGGEVAKLFAKHFKVAEHAAYCQRTKFSIGAGTPDRIVKLIEAGALLLDNIAFIVLDLKKDLKKRHLLDIPEARMALFKLLANDKVNARFQAGLLKLVLY